MIELPETVRTRSDSPGILSRIERTISSCCTKREYEDNASSSRVAAPSRSRHGDAASYPLFVDPQEYLEFRKGGFFSGYFKRWSEWRAIDRCLRGVEHISTVCDAPCGPGRLFPYWQKRKLRVIGVDLSVPMVEAAKTRHSQMDLCGYVIEGDVFHLQEYLAEAPDLVVSVRFCYYFDREERIGLIHSLASVVRRYLLLQYKTSETRKGRRNLARIRSGRRSHPSSKRYCSYRSITEEIGEAGLRCLRVQPISEASDFVFVLARKPI